MQDQWYGDKRDIVKWGSLVHMAREYGTQSILQVAFFRLSNSKHVLQISEDCEVPLAPEVWDHFRDIRQIKRLERGTGRRIDVFDTVFCEPRDAYVDAVADDIRKREHETEFLLVFLDPDTGIAPPKSKPSLKHVLPCELRHIYRALRTGDVLVLYQHQRRTKDWLAETRRQFADAIQVDPAKVRTVTCPCLAKDVAFFVARRDGDDRLETGSRNPQRVIK